MPETVTINARKFDNSIHRSWSADLIERRGQLLVFKGEFESEVSHPDLGIIEKGTVSHEYYWLDRWFNVFRFHEPAGALRNYYCNINLPPRFENGVLDYIDLDLDVLVWSDFSVNLLDRDDFEANAAVFGYPVEVLSGAEDALRILTGMIEERRFPFDLAA